MWAPYSLCIKVGREAGNSANTDTLYSPSTTTTFSSYGRSRNYVWIGKKRFLNIYWCEQYIFVSSYPSATAGTIVPYTTRCYIMKTSYFHGITLTGSKSGILHSLYEILGQIRQRGTFSSAVRIVGWIKVDAFIFYVKWYAVSCFWKFWEFRSREAS